MSVDEALAGHRADLDTMAVRLGRRVDADGWRRARPRRAPRRVTVRTVALDLVLVDQTEARRARWRAEKRAQREQMTPQELADWRRWRAMDLRAWRARRAREAR